LRAGKTDAAALGEESGAGAALGGMGDSHRGRSYESPGEFGRARDRGLEQFPIEIAGEIADDSRNGAAQSAESGRRIFDGGGKRLADVGGTRGVGEDLDLLGLACGAFDEVGGDARRDRADEPGGAAKPAIERENLMRAQALVGIGEIECIRQSNRRVDEAKER
jgi:hypothetical protein